MADKLTEKGKRKIKSRMTGGDSTGILFPNVYSVEKKKTKAKKKPVQSRSRHQSVAEDKRLSPRDKYERDVLGRDMSDKYKEIKVSNTQTGLSKGRKKFQHGGRTNLLEELGRVEGESSNRNRRAEVSRIHGELNKGYKSGGAVLKGKKVGIQIK